MSLYEIGCHFIGCLLVVAPLMLGYIVAEIVARRRRSKERT